MIVCVWVGVCPSVCVRVCVSFSENTSVHSQLSLSIVSDKKHISLQRDDGWSTATQMILTVQLTLCQHWEEQTPVLKNEGYLCVKLILEFFDCPH